MKFWSICAFDKLFLLKIHVIPNTYAEDAILYGHTNNPEYDANRWPRPRIVGKTFGLDTISEGILSAVRLPGGNVFQSGRYIY